MSLMDNDLSIGLFHDSLAVLHNFKSFFVVCPFPPTEKQKGVATFWQREKP
jgi:hypothetical protein